MGNWTFKQLAPFGIILQAMKEGMGINSIPVRELLDLIGKKRVVAIRGFTPLEGKAFPEFCKGFGEILEWDFGAVNELRNSPAARNYLYTNHEVPFHWDGAFAGRIPRFIFFHCDIAPREGSGGETLFSDTTLMLKFAPRELRKKWSAIDITYTTEKIVHYGGTFTSPMITCSPAGVEQVIRFAEPVVDLNPVHLKVNGLAEEELESFLKDMHHRLNDELVCYRHQWMNGDILIADNHVLLHGRRAFDCESGRLIRRVNIL